MPKLFSTTINQISLFTTSVALLMHTLSPSSPLRVQLITDGKPGHLNQLKGLLDQLKALTDVEAEWLDVGKTRSPFESMETLSKATGV